MVSVRSVGLAMTAGASNADAITQAIISARSIAPEIGACLTSTPHKFSAVVPSFAAKAVSACNVFSSILPILSGGAA
jgi:hypothetical protein